MPVSIFGIATVVTILLDIFLYKRYKALSLYVYVYVSIIVNACHKLYITVADKPIMIMSIGSLTMMNS